ncbi:MAG: isochorismate synthase [Prevotellaceae bacterium]|nr:isochorismate synthase [Prevotellaceae bacterium]
MNLPYKSIEEALDRLACGDRSFVLYRMPQAAACRFIGQASGEVERIETLRALDGKRGFVFAPFQSTEKHPSLLIRPDITASGWAETEKALARMEHTVPDSTGRLEATTTCLTDEDGKKRYAEAFDRFITPVRERRFRKLVLSRALTRPTGNGFSPAGAFLKACRNYPHLFVYLCHTPLSGTWIGSTPEILLSGHHDKWHTVALAGTLPAQEGSTLARWDRKNREEQDCVADYLRTLLCRFDDAPCETGPYPVTAGALAHLQTDFHFRLTRTDRLGELLEALHPTPAVCGLPKAEAFRFICAHEGYDRAYYSGFTGLLDPEGQTDLYVNLRCMQVLSGRVTLYAGGGILPTSDAEEEWEETGRKMETMGNILDTHSINP